MNSKLKDRLLRFENRGRIKDFQNSEAYKQGEPFGWHNCYLCYLPMSECKGNHYDEEAE